MRKIIVAALMLIICLSFISCSSEDINNKKAEKDKGNVTVENLETALYNKVKSEILKWNEDGIYAISFFINANESNEYMGFENVSSWAISYNTEKDCNGADELDEERWNYAFWRQDETMIIDTDEPDVFTEKLFDWYAENGITNIGEENEDEMYDEDCNYIGKGPSGHYELLQLASSVAKKLHEEGIIKEHFDKEIPIIIHGLEYAWYDLEATEKANPDGQAAVFFNAMKELGFC